MRSLMTIALVLCVQVLFAQQVIVTVDNSWQGGYNGKVSITPNQDITDWHIEISLDPQVSSVSAWNADYNFTNGILTLDAQAYNASILAGQTYDAIGFSVSGPNAPAPTLEDFVFSGTSENGGETLTDSHWVLDTTTGDLTLHEDVTGNVGIGNEDPSFKLHLESSAGTGFQFDGSNTSWAGCYMNGTNGGRPFYGYKNAGEYAGWTYVTSANTYVVHAGGNGASGSDAMHVRSNGNVGIGNNNPSFKLHLAGTAGTGLQYDGSATDWAGCYMNGTNGGKPFFGYKRNGEFAGWTYVNSSNTYVVHAGGNGSAGSDAMFVRSNGNVGVGNSTPSFKLHLSGSAGTGLQYDGSATDWAGCYMNGTNGGKPFFGYKRNGEFAGWTYVNSSNTFVVHAGGNGSAGSDVIYARTNGNVGIGNSNPSYKLHINGTGGTGFQYNGSNEDWAGCYMNATGGGKPFYGYKTGGEFTGWTFVGDNGNYVIHAGGNGESGRDAVFVNPNGNVGIGTQTLGNGFRLSVNGSIRAKEIVVETNWADYVFEEGYELISLEEVEAFVNENGHLPNVPSAKEVQENGVGLAESQTVLLEKVEELTLYVIELNKEIEALKAEKEASSVVETK